MGCKRLKKLVIEDFKKIPIDKNKIVPKVYLLGEFFVLLDPYTNKEIEKTLGDLGVEVEVFVIVHLVISEKVYEKLRMFML